MKEITSYELIENVDYMMIPATMMIEENEAAWDVRIMQGQFVETIIRFGNIKFGDDELLHFNFIVVSSPDPDLTSENEELQQFAGSVLINLLEQAIKHDALVLGNPSEN